MYELEGEREFCHFSSLSVEITSCSSFLLGEFRFVWWEKVVIDPECDQSILIEILVKEKRGSEKKEKSEWSRFVSINVKRPHALLECKEMLIRNVSRDQYFVQSWLMLDLPKGFSSCFFSFLLFIVSSFIKIVWKVDFSHERSGTKLKVWIYWFQGVTKSFNLEKIG